MTPRDRHTFLLFGIKSEITPHHRHGAGRKTRAGLAQTRAGQLSRFLAVELVYGTGTAKDWKEDGTTA